jgi:type IV pilus assembly protein PilX
MAQTPRRFSPRGAAPRAQHGTMLIIALIVLVSLTLAGVAMMRSVDTASIVSGNIAFKQSTVVASDQGIQAAYGWIQSVSGSATLYNDGVNGTTSQGYVASVAANESASWWDDPVVWGTAYQVNGGFADASGNIVYYLIHRMCPPSLTGKAPNSSCASTADSVTISGEGVDQSTANFFTRPPAYHYRITVRSQGPRNSVSIVQTMIRSQ